MGKKYIDLSLVEFSNELAAKKSMPGGGSAAGYVAVLASDLASMVANFTLGKKKYAMYDEDIKRILDDFDDLKNELLKIIDDDVEAFLPLADCYRLPDTTEAEKKEKHIRMQKCLKNSAHVPMRLLRLSKNVCDLHEELLVKGSKLLISDVGVGVALLRASVLSAKLNILINIKDIEDEDFRRDYSREMVEIVQDVVSRCDLIYSKVLESMEV